MEDKAAKEGNNKLDDRDLRIDWWPLFLIMSIIMLAFFLYGIIVIRIYGIPTNPAEFGDMFGGVNALFSGLAFSALVYTIYIQLKEFKVAAHELKITSTELKETREVQQSNLEFNRLIREKEFKPVLISNDPRIAFSSTSKDKSLDPITAVDYPIQCIQNHPIRIKRTIGTFSNSIDRVKFNISLITQGVVQSNQSFYVEIKFETAVTWKFIVENIQNVSMPKKAGIGIIDADENKWKVTFTNILKVSKKTDNPIGFEPLYLYPPELLKA